MPRSELSLTVISILALLLKITEFFGSTFSSQVIKINPISKILNIVRGLFIAESIYLRRNSIPAKITAKVTAAHGINLATFIAIIILLPLFR
jgi:hypothetical protein